MPKLKIYIAAAWSKREEMQVIAGKMHAWGDVKIISRWLGPQSPSRRVRAMEDLVDVRRADALVRFSDDLSKETVPARLATGSRMFEMGVAYERGTPVFVVGGYQPIFDHLPKVIHVRHLDELRVELNRLARTRKRGK